MPSQYGKQCPECRKFTWSSDRSAECCGRPLFVEPSVGLAIQCWDASKIKNDDKRRPFHNGLNEYVPDNAGKNYLDQRARAKGLTLTYENDHRKLRGTKVTPRKFVGG